MIAISPEGRVAVTILTDATEPENTTSNVMTEKPGETLSSERNPQGHSRKERPRKIPAPKKVDRDRRKYVVLLRTDSQLRSDTD